jgi:hypothetical protein
MKTTKRFLTALVAMTMVCGSAVTVYADDPTTPPANEIATPAPTAAVTQKVTGTGADEGFVQMKLLRVVLPTDSLGYTVDAQGLVKKSFLSGEAGKQHYGDAYTVVYSTKDAEKDVTAAKTAATADNNVLDDGFVFFEYTDAKTQKQTLSNHMDLVIKNKGTFDVSITPEITFKKGSGSSALTGTTWTKDLGTGTDASGLVFNLYEKTKDADGKIGYEKLKENSTDTTARALQIANVKDLYKTTYEGAEVGYKYSLDEEAYASKEAKLDNKATFTIEAFSNPEKVTQAVTAAGAGSIEIVWKVEEYVAPATTP